MTKPLRNQEHYSNAAVVTATLTTLTPKNSASRSHDRWVYGIIGGGGANLQYINLVCDGVFPANGKVQIPSEYLGTDVLEPTILPRALFIPKNNDLDVEVYQDSGGNEQENVTILYTVDAPPADIPAGYLYTRKQAVTASDEVLGAGTNVKLPNYGKTSVTHTLVKLGGHGAGAATLLVGVSSDALDAARYSGEGFVHAPGSADVGLGQVMWDPSEEITFAEGDLVALHAMDISGGTVQVYAWFAVNGL